MKIEQEVQEDEVMEDFMDNEKAHQALTSPLWSVIIAINLKLEHFQYKCPSKEKRPTM